METVTSWTTFPNPTYAVLHHELVLDKNQYKPGQSVLLRAVARDRRELNIDSFGIKLKLEAQETVGPWHQIHMIAPEAKTAGDVAQLDALRTELFKMLQQQIKARVEAGQVTKQPTPAEAGKLTAEVGGQQVEIQKAAVSLVQTVGKTDDEERVTIKRVVNKLAFGEMLDAVRQAEAMEPINALADYTKPVAELNATQDRIIDVLRRLMNEIRGETARLLSEMEQASRHRPAPGRAETSSEAQAKLEDFLKEQKKVIEATENLAKRPVEDFTEKDKQLLKDLAAKEDDLSKFMADLHSDLSKLPEQDFANPSHVERNGRGPDRAANGEDALTKKSAEIAVPLEQLGAEMAKEITSNIEKWLPDTPKRDRWSQEEPLTDDMKEAPMAELPGELEDIVGKLMEEEEDLFDEMEDTSSSWADSLDKGAGWDAMDGPISNNSAKGVTGNRLPSNARSPAAAAKAGRASPAVSSWATRPSARAAARPPAA